MPELPEVETHVQELTPLLTGHSIQDVRIFWPKAVVEPDLDSFCHLLVHRTFQTIARRAKYMLFHLDADWILIVHLRMTGTFRVVPTGSGLHRHARAVLGLDNRQDLCFLDQRKFGRLWLVQDPTPVLAHLGPEPLSRRFTGKFLVQALCRRTAPIKAVLLDQAVAAGVGNIYADEALFRARIHPRRPARDLSEQECLCLCRSIRRVIRTGIRLRGSFISTYRPPSGVPGRFQAEHRVFRRTDEPCLHCGTPIARAVIAQRSTHFCPRCQV